MSGIRIDTIERAHILLYVSKYAALSVPVCVVYACLNIRKAYSLRHADCCFFTIVNNNLSLLGLL